MQMKTAHREPSICITHKKSVIGSISLPQQIWLKELKLPQPEICSIPVFLIFSFSADKLLLQIKTVVLLPKADRRHPLRQVSSYHQL